MKANLLRYLTVLTFGLRLTLAAANTQPSLESVSAAPVASRPAAPVNGTSGQVINGPPLSLYHGEVHVLDFNEVTRIAVGSGDVLQAQVVASNQVVLIGRSAGSTSLRVWTRNGAQFSYEVGVRSFDVSQILRDVRDLLAGEPGMSVKQVDGHVLIEGDYTNAQAASRLEALQKIYPQIVSTVPVREAPRAVQKDKMVYMNVRVVEIEKDVLRNLGVNWDLKTATGLQAGVNAFTSRGTPSPTPPANGGFFGISANLGSVLDVAERAGQSWTLAEPTVSCRSGGEAKFTVGGEIPIPVANGPGVVQVVYKEYGIILEFKPVADDQGNISSSIVAEVSQPDTSFANTANNGLIAFTKTRTQTEVTLRENQTLVISGLLSNMGNQSAAGIPGAKDIPVLGSLFKSKQYKNRRTELVIVVTPHAIDAGSELNANAINHADEMQKRVAPVVEWTNARKAE